MKIIISATLRSFFGRNTETEAKGNTIEEILNNLADEYPEAKRGLFDEHGKVREFIRIYADGQDLFLWRILCLYCEGEQP